MEKKNMEQKANDLVAKLRKENESHRQTILYYISDDASKLFDMICSLNNDLTTSIVDKTYTIDNAQYNQLYDFLYYLSKRQLEKAGGKGTSTNSLVKDYVSEIAYNEKIIKQLED